MAEERVIEPEKIHRTRQPSDRRWLALYLVCAAQLMIVLDGTIVNVALPAIQDSLRFSETGFSWVVNAYLLTFGGFMLLGGKGQRPVREEEGLRLRARPLHPRLAALRARRLPVAARGGAGIKARKAPLEEHRGEVARRIEDLQRSLGAIDAKIAHYRAASNSCIYPLENTIPKSDEA